VRSLDGPRLREVLVLAALDIEENKDFLCRLDSAVGDGDHGVSMTIGMRAARRNLDELSVVTPCTCFLAVSEAFADEVGASIGPLYEVALADAAGVVEERRSLDDVESWRDVFTAVSLAIVKVGGASTGDKTMLDAWSPAAAALEDAAQRRLALADALEAASAAAWQGVELTKDLIPRLGRASRLGERARGYQDAGATSASILIGSISREVGALA
jgi:dihydroxyacetone kinase-like protein